MLKEKAKLVRVTTNNQVAIPVFIMRDLALQRGSYLEVEEQERKIVMTPKRLVDEEDFKSYEALIKKGRAQLGKGEVVDWEDVKKKLSSRDRKKKTA